MYQDYEYSIKCEQGHYVALDRNGHFICSRDTFEEVRDDMETMLKESKLGLQLK